MLEDQNAEYQINEIQKTNKQKQRKQVLFMTVHMLQRETSLVYQHRLCTQPQIT